MTRDEQLDQEIAKLKDSLIVVTVMELRSAD